MRIAKVDDLLEHIAKHSYPVCQQHNSIENGMTLTGIKQCIDELAVTLSRREMEVLNTCLSTEIMKQHLHYGEGASNERLDTLYSLRNKLVRYKGDKAIAQVIALCDDELSGAPDGSTWSAEFPDGRSGFGTITIGDQVYTAYIADISGHAVCNKAKHKFNLIEA